MYALTTLALLLGVTDITYRAELQHRAGIDFRNLTGTWKLVKATYSCFDLIEDNAENAPTCRFVSNKIWWTDSDAKQPMVLSRPPTVDPGFQDRRAIDIEVPGEKPFRAICSVKQDELVIALSVRLVGLFAPRGGRAEPGDERPKSFEPNQAGVVIMVLKK